MAKTPERKVKDAGVKVVEKYNAYYFFPEHAGYGRAGIPDMIVCYRGMFLGVEFKAGYNKPTALQEREMAMIEKAGGSAMVIREDTVDALEQWFVERSG